MTIGTIAYSPSSWLTAQMAAVGLPSAKHEKSAKLECLPLISALNLNFISSVILVSGMSISIESLENELKASAFEYLKYLHALELSAGYNFKVCRPYFDGKIAEDIERAIDEETYHARLIRDMLHVLGSPPLRELKAITQTIMNGLQHGLDLWPKEIDPLARIAYNEVLERRFASTGIKTLWPILDRTADAIQDHDKRHDFRWAAWEFYATVKQDELFHVRLDGQIRERLESLWPGYSMEAIILRAPPGRGPFRGVVRALQRFLLTYRRIKSCELTGAEIRQRNTETALPL